MTEFVGRTGSNRVYSYPETRRGVSPLTAFARNFATGPKAGISIGDPGIQVQWNSIDVGVDPDEDVPITPISTGIVRISGVIAVSNDPGAPVSILVEIQVDDVTLPIPLTLYSTVADAGQVAIPFLAEVTLPIGVTSNIQIFVTGDAGTALMQESSSIEVQEVAVATG